MMPQMQSAPRADATIGELASRTVYVAGIDSQLTEQHLLEFFSFCGPITNYKMCGDSGQPTRFAFIEFGSVESAMTAMSLTGSVLGRAPLRISPSKTAIQQAPPSHSHLTVQQRDAVERTIHVGGVDVVLSEDHIREFFNSVVGPVSKVALAGDTAHNARFAFVEFYNIASAKEALKLSGTTLAGRPIKINPSRAPILAGSRRAETGANTTPMGGQMYAQQPMTMHSGMVQGMPTTDPYLAAAYAAYAANPAYAQYSGMTQEQYMQYMQSMGVPQQQQQQQQQAVGYTAAAQPEEQSNVPAQSTAAPTTAPVESTTTATTAPVESTTTAATESAAATAATEPTTTAAEATTTTTAEATAATTETESKAAETTESTTTTATPVETTTAETIATAGEKRKREESDESTTPTETSQATESESKRAKISDSAAEPDSSTQAPKETNSESSLAADEAKGCSVESLSPVNTATTEQEQATTAAATNAD